MSFVALGLDRRLLDAVSALGFEKPTPIQSDATPPGLAGRDLLACAATGSGKSAAFLLPILQRLLGGPKGRVRVLVLSPTRELAAQIDVHRQELGRFTGTTGAAVYGGVGMGPQERRHPQLLAASRKRRIARGSGTSVQEINQLLKQYLQMRKMMKQVKGNWLKKAFGN